MAYRHIVVTIDGSETALAAVKQAATLAKAFDSKVTAIYVLTAEPILGAEFMTLDAMQEEYLSEIREKAQQDLKQAEQLFAEQGISIDSKICEGFPVHHEIVESAKTLDADLIVMGSHGRKGFKKLVLGSVAQSVLGESHIPVLVVRG
ncbi:MULTISPECIES: universal stress protein [unclassified Acinetobacter]|uniref:universal stress protein n=1 Tax=unclassified Acinetobacter TaxID=196816 RepID=UPI0035B9A93F